MLEIPAEAATLELLPQGQSLGDVAEIHARVLSTKRRAGRASLSPRVFLLQAVKTNMGRREGGGVKRKRGAV